MWSSRASNKYVASLPLITLMACDACSPVPGPAMPKHPLMGQAFALHVSCSVSTLVRSCTSDMQLSGPYGSRVTIPHPSRDLKTTQSSSKCLNVCILHKRPAHLKNTWQCMLALRCVRQSYGVTQQACIVALGLNVRSHIACSAAYTLSKV